MKPNNFFVICFLPLQFTHITFQHVPFQYLKGFFRQMKGKKVMAKKLWQINKTILFLEFANLRIIWLKSGEFQRYSIGGCLTRIPITFLPEGLRPSSWTFFKADKILHLWYSSFSCQVLKSIVLTLPKFKKRFLKIYKNEQIHHFVFRP